jgi:deazaflavin-dependent oxidoreductase (nitroreductase family)
MSFNDGIIDEFRANNGHVSAHGFGDSLLLVHNVGVRTGETHVSPLMGLPDGRGWLITASAAGAARHPAWYHNLLAHPQTSIEAPGESGVVTVPVVVEDLKGADRDESWARFVQRSPSFARYEEKAGDRVIPVLRLGPSGD